ncbi:unnamed protein product [Jaminaea pallidilutea]
MIWQKGLLVLLGALTSVSAVAVGTQDNRDVTGSLAAARAAAAQDVSRERDTTSSNARDALSNSETQKMSAEKVIKLNEAHAKRSGRTHVYTNRANFSDALQFVERFSPYNKYHGKPDGTRWPVTHVYAFDKNLNEFRLVTPEEHLQLIEKRGLTDVLSGAWEVISSPWVAVPVGLALSAYFGPVVIARWANLWTGWQRAQRFNAYLRAAPQDVILQSETRDSAIALTQITIARRDEMDGDGQDKWLEKKSQESKRFDVPAESSHKVNVMSEIDGSSTQECGASGTHADLGTEQPSESLAHQGAMDSINDAVNQNFADTEYELVNMGRQNEFAANYIYTCNRHGAGQGYGT